MVGDGHPVVEPPGNHLSPAGPRFAVLVHYCGVAAQEDGRCHRVGLHDYLPHSRGRPVELERETVVPREIVLLAGLDLHLLLVVDAGGALVDDERTHLVVPLAGDGPLHHEPARLSPDHRFGRPPVAAQRHRDAVVAVGHSHREIKRGHRTGRGRGHNIVAIARGLRVAGLRTGHIKCLGGGNEHTDQENEGCYELFHCQQAIDGKQPKRRPNPNGTILR